MGKPRIITILGCFDYPSGVGATKRVRLMAKGLKELGDDVKVIVIQAPNEYNYAGNIDYHGYIDGTEYRYANKKLFSPSNKFMKIYDYYKAVFVSIRWLKADYQGNDRVLIFYGLGLFELLPFFIYAKIKHIPVFLDRVEDYTLYYSNHTIITRLKHLSHRWLINSLSIYCSGIFVISTYLKNQITRHNKNIPVLLLPPFVDTERFKSNISRDDTSIARNRTIVYVGTMSPKDGLDDLIKAFKKLQPIHDCTLVIVGGTEKSKTMKIYREMVNNLHISNNVMFTGYVTDDKLLEILANASLLAVTRPNTIVAKAGFPSKIVEYLSMGKPILATDIGDLKMYLDDLKDIIFAIPGDCEDIFRKMSFYFDHPQLKTILEDNSRAKALKYFDYRYNMRIMREFLDTHIDYK